MARPPPATVRETIRSALEASGRAVAELLRKAVAAGGKVKGFKPHATAFLGYLISHESHHRSQVGWTLKHAGHPLVDGERHLRGVYNGTQPHDIDQLIGDVAALSGRRESN